MEVSVSDDLPITYATSYGDLERRCNALMVDLGNGRRGVTDPLVYEALSQLKIRRFESKGLPAAEAEAAAREETLRDIERLAAKQVETVRRQHPPASAADAPAPLPDDAGDDDQLSPGEVMELISDRREGKAHPGDVRRLLATFCKYGAAREEVVEYLREGCATFVKGDYRTLDRALGLTRGRGKPRADEDRPPRMAMKVLRSRLSGNSFEVATEETAESFGCGVTTISEAWAACWPDAIDALLAERMLFGCGDPSGKLLTPEEAKRLEHIERSLVNTPAYSRHFAGVTKRSKRHK
jgi:hypothetical protein